MIDPHSTPPAGDDAAGPETQERPRHVITVRGPLALLAARLDGLPPGEYVITLDKTHQRRPRWRIGSQPASWEKAHREDQG